MLKGASFKSSTLPKFYCCSIWSAVRRVAAHCTSIKRRPEWNMEAVKACIYVVTANREWAVMRLVKPLKEPGRDESSSAASVWETLAWDAIWKFIVSPLHQTLTANQMKLSDRESGAFVERWIQFSPRSVSWSVIWFVCGWATVACIIRQHAANANLIIP